MKRSLIAATAVVLVAAAGCGSGTDSGAGASPTPGAAGPPTAAAPTSAPAAADPAAPTPVAGVPALTGTPTDLTKPTQAQAGTGQPPTQLVTQDIVVGTGPVAAAQNTVDVQYTGTLWADGTVFDSSWSRGEPTSFPLSGVIPGFAQGIEGMHVGGRRVIVIPPDVGYGADDNGPIPGNSTLVFVVDLVGVQ